MFRTHSFSFEVEFADCDPAQIAFYGNFFRWYDAGLRRFFQACGVPPWRELEAEHGIIGTPVVTTSSRYQAPTVYGDVLTLTTGIEEWRRKSFVVRHRLFRGEEAIANGTEVRIFAIRDPDNATRIRAVEAPDKIRSILGFGA